MTLRKDGSTRTSLWLCSGCQNLYSGQSKSGLCVSCAGARRTKVPDVPLSPERAALVKENVGLAYHWARKALGRQIPGTDGDEVRGAAIDGLVRATRSYDWSKGFAFTTYATFWIRQAIGRYFEVRKRRRVLRGNRRMVLASDFEDPGLDLPFDVPGHREVDPLRGLWVAELLAQCKKLLDPRWWRVLELRYLEGMTLQEAGVALGISRERVRQIQDKALDRLRIFMVRDVYTTPVGK